MANFEVSRGRAAMKQSQGARFDAPEMKMRSGGGFGAAAGMTDLAGVFQANRQRAPKFDRMGSNNIKNRAEQRAAAMKAEAQVQGAGLQSISAVRSAETIADAQVKAAQKAAGAAKQGAMMSGLGSILGAGLGLIGSDERMKDNINRIDDALETLRALKPVTFHYKEEFNSSPERKHHGFLAQDFAVVLPDATYYDESIDKMCIDTGDLIGLLVRGIQQLEARVAYLEAQRALAGVK